MEYQEFNIKPQEINLHCCTCLNKLGGYKQNVGDLLPSLLQILQQCTGHRNLENDLYPKCICEKCFGKLAVIEDFQRMSKRSLQFLEQLVKSFTLECDLQSSPVLSETQDVCSETEVCVNNSNNQQPAFSNESDNYVDPLFCNSAFEQVSIKPEIHVTDESIDSENNSYDSDEETIQTEEETKSPQNKHSFQYKCNKCEQSFVRKRQLNDHMSEEHEEWSTNQKIICKFGCGKHFPQLHTAEKHYKKSHLDKLEKEKSPNAERYSHKKGKISAEVVALKIKIKEKLQQLNSTLTETEKEQKIKIENEINEPQANTTNKRTCQLCLKSFCSVSGLNVHMRTHLDERPFQCDKCDRGFNKRSLLANHLKEVHTEVPIEIPCKYGCGRVFQRQVTAMNHYRLKHILPAKGIKPDYKRVCEECGKVFKNISILKEHRNIHLPPEERPYKCDQCDKRFSMKKNLTQHLLRHAGIKNFECTICGLKTTTSRELRVHMNYHTKEKQSTCPYCSKVFNSRSNMKRHEQVVHQGIKKYNCRYCEESFGKPDTLKHHEMRHTGERPHKCEICDRAFIQMVALKAHMKTHNKLF